MAAAAATAAAVVLVVVVDPGTHIEVRWDSLPSPLPSAAASGKSAPVHLSCLMPKGINRECLVGI